MESWPLPKRNTKVEHLKNVLQAQKILQLIIEKVTTPDFATKNLGDTSCVCARYAANPVRRNDLSFRTEVADIHLLQRLDEDSPEFTHNRHELSKEDVQHPIRIPHKESSLAGRETKRHPT